MPYKIDLSTEVVADYQRLQPWAQRSLEAALLVASDDPHRLPAVPQQSEHARILSFADGRGLCMVEIDDDAKRLAVRLIEPPR
ncbi:hypothetical protein [Actinacidiphila glaucinigra]|uniref:Uncharacterized protein n=1 Tax=Actinacidiphila glaucinigra TaxID=235986 RepID=A0A239IHB4_9ACTN|nr:hypothetical protein [Actinacidiphila glaucinigra]SNS92648.1 hypothetical protein SAMN05216252_110150 [Actinacidiphila glaucinigra]